ncbi:MAG: ribosome-binding ATPase [Actinomycetota bacterium]|nr:ribosome-binding ATPase [Actinomycetota bacterium]
MAAGVDLDTIRELSLLTTKPFIYVFNPEDDQLTDESHRSKLPALVALPVDAIYLNAKLEMDLAELEPADALELLDWVGVEEAGMEQLA